MLVIKLYEECVKGSIKNLKSAACFRAKRGRERRKKKRCYRAKWCWKYFGCDILDDAQKRIN